MRTLLGIALIAFSLGQVAQADDKPKTRTIEIFMQQKERKSGATSFYMWVHDEDAEVVGTAPKVGVGYSFGKGGAVYLESKDIGNAMFFVHPYDKKKSGANTRIEFGGSRENDIHIYLPENTKAVVRTSSIKYTPPKPETDDE